MPARGSSTTSSRTSTSSSTSDAPAPAGERPAPLSRLLGIILLGHPFPSLLNAIVTAGLALFAGGSSADALRLGAAMLAFQVSIGAFNDFNDRESDARSKPSKPIPAGRASAADARIVTNVGLVAGVLLSQPSGGVTVGVGLAGLACGYLYDAWFKRTVLSWLPLAVALPLLPAYAWLGVGAGLPPGWALLVPLAVLAGAALAISNALVDLTADRAAGLMTVVARLGAARAWLLHAALLGGVVAMAFASLAVMGSGDPAGPGAAVAAAGSVLAAGGAWLMRPRGDSDARVPRRGLAARAWEVETLGIALLGLGWIAAVAGAGR